MATTTLDGRALVPCRAACSHPEQGSHYTIDCHAWRVDDMGAWMRHEAPMPEWRRRRLEESRGRIVAYMDTTGSVML